MTHGQVILFIACVLAGAILHDRRDYWRAIRWGDSRRAPMPPVSQLPALEEWHRRYDAVRAAGRDPADACRVADMLLPPGSRLGITAAEASLALRETIQRRPPAPVKPVMRPEPGVVRLYEDGSATMSGGCGMLIAEVRLTAEARAEKLRYSS